MTSNSIYHAWRYPKRYLNNLKTTVKDASTQAEYVSAEKLADLFDPPLSIGFIRALQKSRTIPYVRLGRRVLFSPAAVRGALDTKLTVLPRGERAA